MAKRERRLSEVLKRGYADKELDQLFELGRFYLECGDIKASANIMHGLMAVAPDFLPAWLAGCCLEISSNNIEQARIYAETALKIQSESVEAALFLAACQMMLGDFNSAGTLLGEIGERLATGGADNQDILRFHKALIARYESRV